MLQDQKLREKADRQKKIVSDKLYPILEKYSTSISHAQQSCQVMKVVVLQAMQKPFRDKNISELKLDEELTKEKDVKDKAMFTAFVDNFKDVSIADCLKVLEGFGGAIDGFIRQETTKRSFSEVKLADLIN